MGSKHRGEFWLFLNFSLQYFLIPHSGCVENCEDSGLLSKSLPPDVGRSGVGGSVSYLSLPPPWPRATGEYNISNKHEYLKQWRKGGELNLSRILIIHLTLLISISNYNYTFITIKLSVMSIKHVILESN